MGGKTMTEVLYGYCISERRAGVRLSDMLWLNGIIMWVTGEIFCIATEGEGECVIPVSEVRLLRDERE